MSPGTSLLADSTATHSSDTSDPTSADDMFFSLPKMGSTSRPPFKKTRESDENLQDFIQYSTENGNSPFSSHFIPFHPISPPQKKRDFPFLRPAQENMGSRCLASSNSCHICPTSPWGQAPARNWGPAWWTLKTTGIDVNNPYWITHSYGIIYYYMKPIWYHRF